MMMLNTTNVGEFLCVGDYICLYSVETEGYAYSLQSSSVHSQVYIYRNQDKDKPNNIPCAQGAVFQVCIQNRYKLNKKLRKYLSQTNSNANLLEDKSLLNQHKIAAEAENTDNAQEQKRQMGKRVRYGEIIQLKHAFTSKFVHMCASQTSQIDKNNMMVMLQEYNAKNAQFRLLPQYKVKSEGEVVQIYDQIVFESIKSPGHFLHASAGFQIDHFTLGSEINLGVERSGFTLVRFHKHASSETEMFVRGGSIIRLFHKELEAYMVAEGLFNEEVTEDVHFRIRVMDQHKPRTLSPPTSGNSFWTIEAENSIFNGGIIQWEQQIRLRHMTTRKYLCIDANREISLTDGNEDPRTVFRLHSVISERDEIRFESYCRIEHVLTGFWLHALKDEDYIRKKFRDVESVNDQTLRGLRWDSAMVRQVSASGESQYDDAFTIQMVEDEHVHEFNYVAGCVPFLLNLIKDRQTSVLLNAKKTHQLLTAMEELRKFMMLHNVPNKDRQKLMRNLRVIDLLVKILQFPLDGVPDEQNIILVFKEAYEILYTYMIGKSRKNALYFAKYIEFFQTQFTQKGGIGLNVAQMIVELIRDKRKIVDRISHSQIDEFVSLLQSSQNYRFLDLLHVLCVCDDVAIPNNQSYIVERWMQCEQKGIFLTARGQDINRQPNILYLSTDGGRGWQALHEFVDETYPTYDKDQHEFLLHQLDLYIALCWGRNDYAINIITKELRYLTWEETFLALRSDILPDAIRAKYCDMTTSLFVDIGNNYSVLAHPNICFIYDYVGSKDEEKSQGDFIVKELVAIFPVLRDWIAEFLSENKCMIASEVGHNMLIEQVVRLLYYLVMFGYYMDAEDVENLLPPLLNLLDGRHDFPAPKDKEKGYSKEAMKRVQQYQGTERFEANVETQAIVNAKYQVLEVLDLLLTYQRNSRLQSFVTKFKIAEQTAAQGRGQTVTMTLLYETFDPHDQSKKALGVQKKVNRELRDMFSVSAIFDVEFLTKVLMDLSLYKYDKMITKSLNILNKIYSSKMNMFILSSKAQILLTQDSARVHREVLKNMPILRRLARAKLDDQQVKLMGNILDDLAEFCHLPMTPDEPHPMNQNIMISNGILNVLFDILIQDIDAKLLKIYGGMTDIFKKAFYLLKLLARENIRVQHHIMERLDILLDVRVVESDLAIALKEVFCGNQATCLKISPRQIQKIVNRAADMQYRAPEFLDLLGMIVKVVGTNLTLKRNQAYVMKYIMQNYKKVAFVLDMTKEERLNILTDSDEISKLRYYISLLELLAACAEGENMFIESLCQTILPIDDLLWVLNNDKIDNVYKKPFLKCLHHVYMKSGDAVVEAGASELSHFGDLWDYMSKVSVEMNRLTDSVKEDPDKIAIYIKTAPEKSGIAAAPDFESSAYGSVLYFLESVLPFLEAFYRDFYFPDAATHPNEIDETDHIAKAIVMFGEIVGPLLFKPQHMKNLVNSLTVIVPISNMPNSNLEHVLDRFASGITVEDTSSAIRRGNIEYYSDEVEINAKFRTFTKNCSLVFAGHNTVSAQLKVSSKREYTELGGDEELPLGEEFQSLIKCFVQSNEKKPEKKFEWTAKLIEQLHISIDKKRLTEHARMEMDELNIKCLQILRAIIHNEERKLPEDWQTRTSEHKIKKILKYITVIQNYYDSKGSMRKCLPHLATRNEDVAREVLGYLCIMLFNANAHVQQSMLEYFLSTREEVFFMAVRDRMALSTNTIKEKRSLETQMEAQRKKDTSKSASKRQQHSFAVTVNALKQVQSYEDALKQQRLSGWKPKRQKKAIQSTKKKKKVHKAKKDKKNKVTTVKLENGNIKEEEVLMDNAGFEDTEMTEIKVEVPQNLEVVEETETIEEEEIEEDESEAGQEYRNDGYIELVLKVMARMCDGQNHHLQDYLREQPDNLKSFNIIGEVTQFLNCIYSNITGKNIDLTIQLFESINEFTADYLREQPDNVKTFNIIAEVSHFVDYIFSNITADNILLVTQTFQTMVEFTAGNQENRIVIYDNKIIDYINFIMRAGDFEDCSTEKILSLRESISNLVISLIEENGPGKSQVAMEVKDTIDKKAIVALMTECYEQHGIDKKKLEELKYIQMEGVPPPKKNKALTKAGESLLKGFKKKERNEFAEQYMDVGFRLYLILARMVDIDPKLQDSMKLLPLQNKAYNYYKKNCMSIEIVKEDELQKVNFRVRSKGHDDETMTRINSTKPILVKHPRQMQYCLIKAVARSIQRVLREEVKEMLKWNVDRSSPSNKIRDLMEWSKDIMKDIAYQRKILSNVFAIILTKGWLVWNHMVTVLSFAINILMLLTWNAKASLGTPGIMVNTTEIPAAVEDPIPVITTLTQEQYTMAIYIMGGTHNFFCLLVFVSYFLGNHPSLPNPKAMWQAFKNTCARKKKDEDAEEDKEKKHQSKMDAKLLSFTTFFYAAFLALSVGGTVFHGYFFAFHLLNIVNNNQLLGGVIKAVTQNGRSLLWVGVLGLVVFYLYAIIGFALMRSMFSPADYLYCDSLWQCTITVIRYGLIGDLFENMKAHSTEADFALFGFVVIYHVSFFIFITTIGLNIIFGIIVDTFSELRDLKWTAESDMRDTCFICSRNSYDFEHHGKGFDHHVRHEHNMWSYIFFFINLNGTKVNDYTALEMYVYKLLLKENYDFFPLDRALSLAAMGQDSTETKIDDLLFQVTTIVEKQKREELEKKRREERMRQKQWEQRHRLGSFRRKAKLPVRSIESDPLSGPAQDEETPLQGLNQQLGLDSPPPPFSPSYSRRPSETGATVLRRSSLVAPGLPGQAGYPTSASVSRHDRFRRRRSVSPLDPRDTLFRRSMSPSRYDDDEEPLLHGAVSPRYDERAVSPIHYGVDNELLDISPVPMSRRQSYDMSRSPRLSLATSPREPTTFFTETDPIPYLRQQSAERRASATYSEGRPLVLPTERSYDRDTESQYDSDDPSRETRF